MFFFNPSEGDSFRFAQTTIIIREFMRNGIDLKVPLPIFGSNSYVPFEFPLFQIIASQFGNLFNFSAIFSARFTAFVFFVLSAQLTFLIAKSIFSKEVAITSRILFLFLPFGMKFAHAPLIEFTSITFMLLSAYFIVKASNSRGKYKVVLNLLFTLSITIGYLSKVTTGIALTPLIFILMLFNLNKKLNFRIYFSNTIFILLSLSTSILAVKFWNSFADQSKQKNVFSQYLISSTSQMQKWNFGDIRNRFEVKSWVTILFQYLGPISAGFFTLLILTVIAYFNFNKLVIVLLLCNVFFPILLFFNLYKNHQYYVSAIYPVLILLLSAGIVSILKSINFESKSLNTILILLLLCSSYSTKHGINYMSDMFNHSKPPSLVEEINSNTSRKSYIMYLGCDWNPEIPYYVDSPTLMVPEWGIRPTQKDIESIDYVVFCDNFPVDRNGKLNSFFPSRYQQVSDNIYKISHG